MISEIARALYDGSCGPNGCITVACRGWLDFKPLCTDSRDSDSAALQASPRSSIEQLR